MNEAKEISRQRLADFLAARLRASNLEKQESKQPADARSLSSAKLDDQPRSGSDVRVSRR